MKQVFKDCRSHRYGYYSTLEQAKTACSDDNNCQAVYHAACHGGSYYLCPIHAQLKHADVSCVYIKSNRGSRIFK